MPKGVYYKTLVFGNRIWSQTELRQLAILHGFISDSEIANRLKRTTRAIQAKARELGFVTPKYKLPEWVERNGNPYSKLTEAERGYIAGIIDGECGIAPHYSAYYCISTSITHKGVTDWLVKTVEGSHSYPRKARKSNHSDYWVWSLQGGGRVYSLLKTLLPYMIIKKEVAELIINDIEANILGRS